MACILLWSSTVRVHGSQAYWKMDVTRKRTSRILELREILLSFQTGFNLVNAPVVCAILESILGLEPSSVITKPRYLKLVTSKLMCVKKRARTRHTLRTLIYFFTFDSVRPQTESGKGIFTLRVIG